MDMYVPGFALKYAEWNITAQYVHYWELSPVFIAEVEAPSGQRSPVQIKDNGDGTVTINYQPSEVGLHNLHVFYNDEPLQGILNSLLCGIFYQNSFCHVLVK